jgi:hypothetical protein
MLCGVVDSNVQRKSDIEEVELRQYIGENTASLPFGRLSHLIADAIFVATLLEAAWHYCLEMLIHF